MPADTTEPLRPLCYGVMCPKRDICERWVTADELRAFIEMTDTIATCQRSDKTFPLYIDHTK
jgi:hypothetical protein